MKELRKERHLYKSKSRLFRNTENTAWDFAQVDCFVPCEQDGLQYGWYGSLRDPRYSGFVGVNNLDFGEQEKQ